MELPLSIFRFLLSHADDEVEDFEPVQKKPQLDSDTEHNGMCLISNLHMSWATSYSVEMVSSIICCFTLQLKRLMPLSLSQQEKNLNMILTKTQPWDSVYSQVEIALHYLM